MKKSVHLLFHDCTIIFENAGELRFFVLERKKVPIHLPPLVRGPNMRVDKKYQNTLA
jgi:hypothetical protein